MSNIVEILLRTVDEASNPINKVKGALSGLADTLLSGFGMGIGMQFGQQFTSTIQQAATAGFNFNKTMEDTKTGIAAVIMANMDFSTASGGVVSAQDKIKESMRLAGEVQEKLKVDALGTAASYQELTGAFNSALSPALTAGVTNLDKVRQITVAATQAMSALGIPTNQASQEIRAMFAGDKGPDNRLNNQLGITKDELAKVKGNAEATAALFLDKLKPYTDMAAEAQKNFSVRLSNLGDMFDQVMGTASKPIFDAFKEAVSTVTGNVGGFQGKLTEIGGKVGQLVTDVSPYIPKLIDFGVALLGAGVSFLSSLTPVLPLLGEVLGFVTGLVEEIGPLGIGVLAAASAFDGIASGATVAAQGITAFTGYIGTVGIATMGAYALAIGVAVAALYAIKLALDLKKETDAAEKSYDNMATGILENLANLEKAHPELAKEVRKLKNEIISAQQQGGDAVADSANRIQTEFFRIQKAARSTAPPITGVKDAITAVAKAPSVDPKQTEALKKLGKEYDELNRKLDEHGKLVGVKAEGGSPLSLAYVELSQKASKQIEYITEKWGASSPLILKVQNNLTKDLIAEGLKQGTHLKAVPIDVTGQWNTESAVVLDTVKKLGTDMVIVMQPHLEELKVDIHNTWFAIKEGINTEMTSAQDFVHGVWGAMAGGIDEFFGDVFTGKGFDLQKTFEGIFGGIQESFSRMVSDMVQRWATGKQSLSEGLQGLETALHPFQGGGFGATAGNAFTGAAVGYGLGSSIGGVSGAPGFAGGAQAGGALGGAIGSIVPVIGTVIGAVVGAIIGGIVGVLAAPNTEMHVYAAFSEMLSKSTTNAFAAAGRKVLESQQNWMVSLFELGGKEAGLSASELTKAYRDAVRKMLTTTGPNGGIPHAEISAGDKGDVEKGLQRFLQENLPRLALQAAFGQTGYGPHGSRDAEGGQGGLDWWINWMDREGGTAAKQLFDPNAPIPRMLAGLGFTSAKITELATQLTADNPEEFKKRLENLVGLVVDINAALGSYAGGRAGIETELNRRGSQTTADYFRLSAEGIQEAAEAMDALTGDEALSRARQIAQAANQRYEEELQAIQRIRDVAKSISESIASQREDLYVRQLDAGGRTNFFTAQINALMAQISSATTEAEVQRIVQQIQKYAGNLTEIAFDKENPNAGLAAWLDQILGQTDTAAQSRLSTLIDDIVSTNDILDEVLTDLKTRFTDIEAATSGVATAAGDAEEELVALEGAARNAGGALDSVSASGKMAAKALQLLAAAASALASAPAGQGDSRSTARDVISLLRRDPGATRSQVGV